MLGKYLAGFSVLVLAATSVSAQWTGTRLGGNIRKTDSVELMQLTVECIAERGPAYAAKVLETVPGSDAEFRLIRKNAGDIEVCMGGSDTPVGGIKMTFTQRPFRRALAAEMVKLQLAREIDLSQIAAPDPWYLVSLGGLPEGERSDAAYLAYMEFGDCVFLKSPQATIDYLRTEQDSKEEGMAIQKLMPALSPCVAAGQELELSHKALQIALNEPVYHRLRRMEPES
ncbi:hypothetical protein SAMN06297468_2811 [Altererythrobacter xiamenensis]|uniref:Uncharacterized protein n=1 Tax=Altererythrobacter xiamenensis TaxID=1316679 RepID=A0A1Y6FI47_9SPHN|nr:hypothetical protein [Altererythrobacter xiamenensis]SMQ74624.1 hypothetical protein SAMN06297468_2811 [Altererythrobacter xiamenensis]